MNGNHVVNGTNGVNGANGHKDGADDSFDALIIGAGFAGLRMLYELRKRGISARVFDAASGVGGTWYWNRYPGARTDSESWVFIFTFLEELGMDWSWKERYPQQPEVEQYLNKMTDYLGLRNQITLNTRITGAHRDESNNTWKVSTNKDETFTCKYLITAAGVLATPLKPPFAGLDSFQGEWYQTGLWPNRKIDFKGKKIGLIGTGATAVQVAPIVAHNAEKLTMFQRTPNYVVPARNYPIGSEQMDAIKGSYEEICHRARTHSMGFDIIDSKLKFEDLENDEAIQSVLDAGWEKGGFHYFFETFSDTLTNPKTNAVASEYVRKKIRAIVDDKEKAELLCPTYPIFSKRPPAGHNYYSIFNRPNVELVNIKNDPIEEITPKGVKLGSKEYEFDMIIFALGFDAVTGTLGNIGIHGSNGESLADVFKRELTTSYGVTLPGFPNMFMIFGPQVPFANGPMVIDTVADWIGKTISYLEKHHYDRIESKQEAAEKWSHQVNHLFAQTVVAQSAMDVKSWYVGANIESKLHRTLLYFGGIPTYINVLNKEIEDGYPGHILSSPKEIVV
ncbi:putative cyclohexanone monooxygenase [Exophiala viscosa]|uniref:putative cyclohexanone monooxygenase n=1 Tax=Exophiala viscosa TaxID=2486360 RepID=UPI0021979079|nr:putative cyclohexanone monooxygenase [Exophiala viscosa]